MRKSQDEMGGYFMTICDQAKNPKKEGLAADKRR